MTVAEVAQRSGRCSIPGNIQSQTGGCEQPDLVKGDPDNRRWVGTRWPLEIPSNPTYPTIIWFAKKQQKGCYIEQDHDVCRPHPWVSGLTNVHGSEEDRLDKKHRNFSLIPYFKITMKSFSYFSSWSKKKPHSALPAALKSFHTCSQQRCCTVPVHWTHLQLRSNYSWSILQFGLLIRLLTTTLLFKEQTPPLTWADGEMSSLVLRGALTNILTWALNRAEVCRATYALWHKFFYAWALLSTMSAGICMMLHAVFVSWSLTMQQGPGSSREWKIRALFI